MVARSNLLEYNNAICKSKPSDLCRGVGVEYLEYKPSGNSRLTFLHHPQFLPLPGLLGKERLYLSHVSLRMRPAPRPTVSAPSLSVLHFLRSQSEQACFSTLSTRACRASPCRGANGALGTVAHALPSVERHAATSSRCQPSAKSSLLNLDFLRPYSHRGASRFSTLASRKPPAPFGFPGENTNTNASRHASTDTRPLWKRPWKDRWRKENKALKTGDSPALPSFLDDTGNTSLARRKTVKGANELKLRCTEFDENGNVTFMDGEFKKSELIAKVYRINLWPGRRGRY